jgi:prepilin-type N-terminal cleavage/methylation domain-containing protein/prepilin-type processing-associated H-X9-DG protein
MRRTLSRRSAFSLLEVLMVSVIIGILIAVMLPAMIASRAGAKGIQCINNFRQLGLALENYQSCYQVLPPGVVNTVGPIDEQAEGPQIGWIVQLLPNMEQQAVWRTIDTRRPYDDPVNHTAILVHISTILCPADPEFKSFRGLGVTSYAGCHHDVEAPIDADDHGVLFLNSAIAKADITDGTSFTITVGEKIITPSDSGWMAGTRSTLRNTGTPINAKSEISGGRPAGSGFDAGQSVVGFSSFHRGGANFAFGDGSVRFVAERIDPRVFRLLGHRADGEPISDGAY